MVALIRIIAAVSPILSAMLVLATPTPTNVIHALLAKRATIDPSLIPDQCKNECSSIVNKLNLPPSSRATRLLTAFALIPTSMQSASGVDDQAGQAAADQITAQCKAGGAPVKSVTISPKKGNSAGRSDVWSFGAVVALGATLLLA
ncbi:hypothetical protein DXG01_007095 [Tephrocybe rancida]|nr:hypothetical protein DXG01_007095 [Tephrocybe rancida]